MFVNTLTADGKYFLRNIEILQEPIQMQLFKKIIIWIFSSISEIYTKFWTFYKKYDPYSLSIYKITDCQSHG